MQTVTVQLTDKSARKALQALEQKQVIRIVKSPRFESPALPGKPLDLSAFKAWIKAAESAPSVSLKAAESTWAAEKKKAEGAFEVRISANAQQNIDEITGYIALVNDQPLNAVKVGDGFYRVIRRVGHNPFAFRECEELMTKTKMYRRALCYSWRIIYRVKNDKVLILGVIHHSRGPAAIRQLRQVK